MSEKIRKFYELGLYTREQVYQFALKGILTEAQYRDIVGEE